MKKFKVLDLSTLLPGPFGTSMLPSDQFEITKVEDINNPDSLRQLWPSKDGVSVVYKAINDQKVVRKIDLKSPGGQEELKNLIKANDIFVHNFRLTRLEKLGLSYEELLKLNPNIKHFSVTGFGLGHKLAGVAVHDLNILGFCGYLTLNNQNVVPTIQIADILTGYELALQIVLALLFEGPVKKEVVMFEAVKRGLIMTLPTVREIKRDLVDKESLLWGVFPCYTLYKTMDNKFMALGAIEQSFWSDFCTTLGFSDMANNQFDDSGASKTKVQAVVATKTQQEWENMRIECFTPVLTISESINRGYV